MGNCTKVAIVDDVPPGQGLRVTVDDKSVAIFNVDGEFYAIDEWCPHEHGPLSNGWVFGHVVMCPFHTAEFDLRTGEVLSLPATRGVRTYRVRRVGDDLEVEV